MNVRRLLLDVDKASARPELTEIAAAVEAAAGVQGLNITVTEIDLETVGLEITVEGENIDVAGVIRQIEKTGAVVHSIDEIAAGSRLVEPVRRKR